MIASTQGRERTEQEFRELFERADLELTKLFQHGPYCPLSKDAHMMESGSNCRRVSLRH
jgi:hypothetical protein